jgi:hypothetical protein
MRASTLNSGAAGLTGEAVAAMRATALSSTLGSIEHIRHVTNEAFGNRTGQVLSADEEHALNIDLRRLLNESETLQRELISCFMRQRDLASASEKMSNASDSLLRPLETIIRVAQAEVSGDRQVGSGEARPSATQCILAPDRHANDDVLALKSIALLDTAATALHDALRTLNSTRALRSGASQPADSSPDTMPGASAELVEEVLEADAAPALRAGGEGRRPLLATLVQHLCAEKGRDPEAVWQHLARLTASQARRCPAASDLSHNTLQAQRQRQGEGQGEEQEQEEEQGESEHEVPHGAVRTADILLQQVRVAACQDRQPSRATAPLGATSLRGGGAGGGVVGGRDGGGGGNEKRHGTSVLMLRGGQGDGVAGDGDAAPSTRDPVAAFYNVNERRLSDSSSASSDAWSWEVRAAPPVKEILPGIPNYNPSNVRTVQELLGVDVLNERPCPTHPSETCEWYDELDPLTPDENNVWVNADGTLHLPEPENMTLTPEYAAALAERASINEQIERNALQYMSRKFSLAERLCVKVSSEDARVRLAALRNLSLVEAQEREEEEQRYAAEYMYVYVCVCVCVCVCLCVFVCVCVCVYIYRYQAECARRKTMTRAQYLREKERAAEIKVLRTEMFKSGYYWNRYMSKEEAREVLDRRDADPLYKDFISKLMPLCLSHTVGPAETLRSWEILHDIYPDNPRRGGVDPYIVYDGEANAELRFDEDERRMGTYHTANNPRHTTYPQGDWSTRIPGAHPLLPAINSKVVRKALEKANQTARAQIAQQKQQVLG